MSDTKQHPDHAEEMARLNRVSGQITGVKKMIEQRRYCLDIVSQLTAIQQATKSLSANILRRHLESCVRQSLMVGDPDRSNAKIQELIDIIKKNI